MFDSSALARNSAVMDAVRNRLHNVDGVIGHVGVRGTGGFACRVPPQVCFGASGGRPLRFEMLGLLGMVALSCLLTSVGGPPARRRTSCPPPGCCSKWCAVGWFPLSRLVGGRARATALPGTDVGVAVGWWRVRVFV
jgi:hypothetical protein